MFRVKVSNYETINMTSRSVDVTVLVNSCDAYEDVWDLFFAALKEHWQHCSFDIVLNTEQKYYKEDSKKIHTCNFLNFDGIENWGGRLLNALNSIESEYVIMLCDDFIIEQELNESRLEQCLDFMRTNIDVAAFYLVDTSVDEKEVKSHQNLEGYCYYSLSKMKDYKINSAPAIWRRSDLIGYVRYADTPWAWEFFGSYRAYFDGKRFFSVTQNAGDIYVYNSALGGAIYRGKWVLEVVNDKINRYKINIDLSKRGVVNKMELPKRSLWWKIKFFYLGFRMIGFGVFLFLIRVFKMKFYGKK